MCRFFLFIVFFLGTFCLFAGEDFWKLGDTTRAPVESVSSTSELEEVQYAGKYVYPPAFVLDGNFMTCWAEAAKGPGIGHSLTIGFSCPVSFDEIQIVNGLAGTRNYYYANNRVTRIHITQKAGKHFQSQEFPLSDGVVGWQSLRFAKVQTAQQLVFRIMAVARGNRYDDTCISDIRLRYRGRVVPFAGYALLIDIQEKMARLRVQGRMKWITGKQFDSWYGGARTFTSAQTGLRYQFEPDPGREGAGTFSIYNTEPREMRGGTFLFKGNRLVLSGIVGYVKVDQVLYFQPRGPDAFLLNGVLYKIVP